MAPAPSAPAAAPALAAGDESVPPVDLVRGVAASEALDTGVRVADAPESELPGAVVVPRAVGEGAAESREPPAVPAEGVRSVPPTEPLLPFTGAGALEVRAGGSGEEEAMPEERAG